MNYSYWLHTQIEPTDIIVTGNQRGHKELKLSAIWESAKIAADIEKKYPKIKKDENENNRR